MTDDLKNIADLSVLIMSYDGFSDTWEACDKCFGKYWKADVPVYLVTNDLSPNLANMNVIKIGDKCYSEGINVYAQECKSKYTLLLMADFLPKSTIDNDKLGALIQFLNENDVDYCSIFKQKDKCKYYKKYADLDNFLEIDMQYMYAINVMPAIWKTSLLLELSETGKKNPWEFELAFQKDTDMRSLMLNCKNLYCKDEIYPLCHTVIKGKYTPEGIKFLKKEGIAVDYSVRGKMSCKERFVNRLGSIMSRKQKDRFKRFLRKFGIKFLSE